jgi:HAD superfamily phosphatase
MDLKDLDLLIWDMDGVLLYVRESYRKSIAEGVNYYFSGLMGLRLSVPLMSPADAQHFKLVEGFNDDWKLTYAAVMCHLVKLVHETGFVEVKDYSKLGIKEKVGVLKELGGKLKQKNSIKLDLEDLTKRMRKNGVGLCATEKTLEERYSPREVEVAKSIWFTDVIKRVFQEMYLGEELFYKKYKEKPYFMSTEGLINKEKPLVSKKTLKKLSGKYKMGVATGRDRFEAEYSIRVNGFESFLPIEFLASSEDVTHGKPDPELLLKSRAKIAAAQKLSVDSLRCGYIGDSVDDIRAAKRAGFYSIGVLSAVPKKKDRELIKKEFMSLGCDLILEDADKLGSIIT